MRNFSKRRAQFRWRRARRARRAQERRAHFTPARGPAGGDVRGRRPGLPPAGRVSLLIARGTKRSANATAANISWGATGLGGRQPCETAEVEPTRMWCSIAAGLRTNLFCRSSPMAVSASKSVLVSSSSLRSHTSSFSLCRCIPVIKRQSPFLTMNPLLAVML